MCCLFGLVDIKHNLSAKEKSWMLSTLGTFCEARGVDATGYSYVSSRSLIIKKKAVPAHEMTFHIPRDAHVIMGHTRMATQGAADKLKNDHPFSGKLKKSCFALAHNGVLTNDKALRDTENLPQTNIDTDSYIAVQLIEKQKTLDFHSLRTMAEMVKGSFTFTVMDLHNNLYIVKGNNPLCLYYFPARGFYIYASTKTILKAALDTMGYLETFHEEILIADGEMLKIDAAGTVTRDHFLPPISFEPYYDYHYDFWEDCFPIEEETEGYRKQLIDFAVAMGVLRQELEHLHNVGLSDFEFEECIYDKKFRRMLLLGTGYYSEREDLFYENDHRAESLPWMQA